MKVELRHHGEQLRIEVRDWGVGFKLGGVGDGHFGLEGIQERAKIFGGRAVIASGLRKGTVIVVELPCHRSEPALEKRVRSGSCNGWGQCRPRFTSPRISREPCVAGPVRATPPKPRCPRRTRPRSARLAGRSNKRNHSSDPPASCGINAAVYYQGEHPSPTSRIMPTTPSEGEFLDRVSRGNPSAAAELDHRYRQRLCRLVQAGVGRQHSAA